MINNIGMQNEPEKYTENIEFKEFLGREFDQTAVNATIEELAEFAFGSIDEAIEAFEKKKGD